MEGDYDCLKSILKMMPFLQKTGCFSNITKKIKLFANVGLLNTQTWRVRYLEKASRLLRELHEPC